MDVVYKRKSDLHLALNLNRLILIKLDRKFVRNVALRQCFYCNVLLTRCMVSSTPFADVWVDVCSGMPICLDSPAWIWVMVPSLVVESLGCDSISMPVPVKCW